MLKNDEVMIIWLATAADATETPADDDDDDDPRDIFLSDDDAEMDDDLMFGEFVLDFLKRLEQ